MPDPVSEFLDAIRREQQRTGAGVDALRARTLGNQTVAPTNPQGGGPDPGFDGGFSTGFDGSVTVTPFQWDFSNWDSGDVWVENE